MDELESRNESHNLNPNGSLDSTSVHETPLELNECAVQQLINALSIGDVAATEASLATLGIRKDAELYNQVGKIARSLHETLEDFKHDLNPSNTTMHNTTLPDATNKLESVLQMTFDAASKTMNLVDQQNQLILEGKAQRKELKQKLKSSENPQELISSYLAKECSRWDEVEEISSQIMVAQSFQDLTGQAVKKVIKLVENLELRLVSLVQLFGSGKSKEEGSESCAEEPKESNDASLSQDDADDILKSLGF